MPKTSMTTAGPTENVHRRLFAEEEINVFAVLDAASNPNLLDKLYGLEPEFECLYTGELEPDIAHIAPYLARLEADSEFASWAIEQGWGRHWGIFATSSADFRALRRHFRTFLTVYDMEGRPMRFRYYDPRVFRIYLPTCNAEELATVFGPVRNYIMEDAGPATLLQFGLNSGALVKKELKALGVR
jgi:hypothetical protein